MGGVDRTSRGCSQASDQAALHSMAKAGVRKTTAARAARLPARRQSAAVGRGGTVCIGVLTGWDEMGPLVDFDGNGGAPVRARSSVATGAGRAAAGQEVVLLIDGRPGRPPVLLGFLQTASPGTPDVDAHIDGKRVELEGRDEIVLRCGPASITLRRNGRVVIRGVSIETNASGTNRIKGGSVSIN